MSGFQCAGSRSLLALTFLARGATRQTRAPLANASLHTPPGHPLPTTTTQTTTRCFTRCFTRCAAATGYPCPVRRALPPQCSNLNTSSGRRSFFSLSPAVIKSYEELPREYRDQAGLSFGRELSEDEADAVFGPGTGAARANRLLRILHGRRVAGTLDDPAFAVHTAQFDEDEVAAALAYLRKRVPVEEVRNAGLRAEDELDEMEQQQQQQQRQTKSRDLDPEDQAAVGYTVDPRYGPSKLDEMRARNLARMKAKEKALEEELKAKGLEQEQQHQQPGPLARREDGSRAITNPKVQEYYDKAQSSLDAPPEMKAWERILPSATVFALVLGFLAAVASVYEEPASRYRLLRELTPSQATVGAVIAINALAFLGWRIPPLWALFNRYMILVVATPRPLTLFTAAFSHTRMSHLLANMVPLWFLGTSLHEEEGIGRAGFLALYLGCGAAGFLSALATYTLRGWLTVTSMGASGATLGISSAYFWEHRMDGFRVFGLPEGGVHGIVFLGMLTALQVAALGRTVKLRVDVASHLGGMAAGILGIEVLNRMRRRNTR